MRAKPRVVSIESVCESYRLKPQALGGKRIVSPSWNAEAEEEEYRMAVRADQEESEVQVSKSRGAKLTGISGYVIERKNKDKAKTTRKKREASNKIDR